MILTSPSRFFPILFKTSLLLPAKIIDAPFLFSSIASSLPISPEAPVIKATLFLKYSFYILYTNFSDLIHCKISSEFQDLKN